MLIGEFNIWVLLGAALIYFILGALWYSPKVFGRMWMEGSGLKEADVNNCGIGVYIGAFVNSFLVCFGLAVFLFLTNSHSFLDAVVVAFFAWVGFVLTTHLSKLLWEKTPLSVFFINISHSLVGLLAIAAYYSLFIG